jgi:RNA polymerase sigma-70 factor (ECF subfamily)
MTYALLRYNLCPLEAQPFVDYSSLSAEELALTCLRSGDETAWSEFVRRFQPLIARAVFRAARQWGEASPQVVDDLIQDTYVKICSERERLLRGFTSSQPDAIYGFIKVFTTNLVHDHFKASRAEKRGGSAISHTVESNDVAPRVADSKCSEALFERSILIQQVDTCLKALTSGPYSERDQSIFWLYYRVGLAASAIAELPSIGLTTKGVESTLLRLTRQIRQRLVERVQARDPSGTEGIRQAESL